MRARASRDLRKTIAFLRALKELIFVDVFVPWSLCKRVIYVDSPKGGAPADRCGGDGRVVFWDSQLGSVEAWHGLGWAEAWTGRSRDHKSWSFYRGLVRVFMSSWGMT